MSLDGHFGLLAFFSPCAPSLLGSPRLLSRRPSALCKSTSCQKSHRVIIRGVFSGGCGLFPRRVFREFHRGLDAGQLHFHLDHTDRRPPYQMVTVDFLIFQSDGLLHGEGFVFPRPRLFTFLLIENLVVDLRFSRFGFRA